MSRIYSRIGRISQISNSKLLFDTRESSPSTEWALGPCRTSCVPTFAAMFVVDLLMVPRAPFRRSIPSHGDCLTTCSGWLRVELPVFQCYLFDETSGRRLDFRQRCVRVMGYCTIPVCWMGPQILTLIIVNSTRGSLQFQVDIGPPVTTTKASIRPLLSSSNKDKDAHHGHHFYEGSMLFFALYYY